MEEETKPQSIKAWQHDSYAVLSLGAIILPIVGIIIGAVYLTKDKKLERKLGEHVLALSILFMIIQGIGWFIFMPALVLVPYM